MRFGEWIWVQHVIDIWYPFSLCGLSSSAIDNTRFALQGLGVFEDCMNGFGFIRSWTRTASLPIPGVGAGFARLLSIALKMDSLNMVIPKRPSFLDFTAMLDVSFTCSNSRPSFWAKCNFWDHRRSIAFRILEVLSLDHTCCQGDCSHLSRHWIPQGNPFDLSALSNGTVAECSS